MGTDHDVRCFCVLYEIQKLSIAILSIFPKKKSMQQVNVLSSGNREFRLGSARINFHFLFCIVLIISGAAFAFPVSYLSSTNVVIGLALIPVSLYCNGPQRFNIIYFIATMLFCTLALRYQTKIFYFFALTFYLLVLTELYIGRCDRLILFLFLFMSPFFHQVIAIMGFPIRLGLSSIAGNILSTAGLNVVVEGNMMMLNGSAFSVDEACMGLNMLSTSMLMGVFAISYRYRRQEKRLSFIKISMFFFAVFILNMGCNLLRIVLLVALKIGPDNPMHEIVGILCFICYIMVPIFFFSSRMINKSAKAIGPVNKQHILNSFSQLCILLCSLFIMLAGIYIHIKPNHSLSTEQVSIGLPGYESAALNDGITKLFNKEVLVYIKPIPEFFSGEHTPLICWRGGGYSFKGVRKSIVNGREVYIGRLIKPGEELFTAWWYSNGKTKTIDQVDWRFRMMKGEERFNLVNVTVDDEASLSKQIAFFLGRKI
jgi:exosortase N